MMKNIAATSWGQENMTKFHICLIPYKAIRKKLNTILSIGIKTFSLQLSSQNIKMQVTNFGYETTRLYF